MSSLEFLSGQQEQAYIQGEASRLGLDPKAVLAVAAHEGVTLPAAVGDQGTSFGPWQMHAGGDLPASIWNRGAGFAQQWANSPSGIDYALQGIKAAVGSATSGPAEIQAQVTQFERPRADLVAGEIAGSIQTYQAGGGPQLLTSAAAAVAGGSSTSGGTGGSSPTSTSSGAPPSGLPPPGSSLTNSTVTSSQANAIAQALIGGHITLAQAHQWWPNLSITGPAFGGFPGGGLLSDLIGAATGVWKQILEFVNLYYLRVLEVIAGGVLVIVSLFMLARGGVPSPV